MISSSAGPFFPIRGGGVGDIGLVPRPQLCFPRKLIFCRAKKQIGQSQNSALDGSFHEDSDGKPIPSTPQRWRSDTGMPGSSGTPPPHILYLLELGFGLEQIDKIVDKYPAFVNYSLEKTVRPLIDFLLDLGVSKSDLPHILLKYPRLCGRTLPENPIPSLAFLETLGVDKSKWPKLICRCPIFLVCNRQKVEVLYELGLSKENIGKILTTRPIIVFHSVEEKLRPSIEYFQSLGVDAGRMILSCPSIMNLSLENNLKPFTEFFLENGFNIEEVGAMISRFGALYAYSLKGNVVPKWEFFLTTDYSRQDLVNYPQYFSCSLEERIKPRYNLMKHSGVKLSLNLLLSRNGNDFGVLLKKRIEKLQSDKS